jgi:enamine deaminase RidA (YjgF/YER057c/UK114 family)
MRPAMAALRARICILAVMSDSTVQLIDTIPGLVTPPGYSYAASAPGELVFFAGQVALDAEGKMVGAGDFAAQVKQTFANLRLALTAAGCTPTSVLKVNYYVVGLTRERLLAIRAERTPFFAGTKPASTLIGVSMLFDPEALLEIEVVAVRAR